MSSYVDIAGQLPPRVRHWYVCGTDRGLVISAVQELRAQCGADASRVEYIDGGNTTPETLRVLLCGTGMVEGDTPPLIVLENADAVEMSWLMDGQARQWVAMLLAVGRESTVTAAEPRYAYFFKRQSGRAIVCKPVAFPKLVNLVQRRLLCAKDTAVRLVEASGGDTYWLSQELQKLVATGCGEQLHPSHIGVVTTPTAVGDFIEHLLSGSKREALRSLPAPHAAVGVLRRLESVVVKGALVYEAQKNVGWSARLMSSRTGLPQSELAMLRPHVNTFGRPATERRLRALARVSSRALRGDRRAWQALVALW